jgi:hypothetical protein
VKADLALIAPIRFAGGVRVAYRRLRFPSRRLLVELGLAALSGSLLSVTLLWREWIELVFSVDPDKGSGSLEWALVAVLSVSTIAWLLAARLEWRRIPQVEA